MYFVLCTENRIEKRNNEANPFVDRQKIKFSTIVSGVKCVTMATSPFKTLLKTHLLEALLMLDLIFLVT